MSKIGKVMKKVFWDKVGALFFFPQLQREKLTFVPLPSKSLSSSSSPTKKKKKKKKKTCSTTRKGPHAPRKFSFQKKKKKKKKRNLTISTSHSFSGILQALQPALFFCPAARAARKAALPAASRFSTLLAAASRFCCSIHRNCSAQRTKSQILQPYDRGLRVKVRVSFSRCENLHFWWTRWCPKLG